MRGVIRRASICAALTGASALLAAAPAEAAGTCSDGSVSGHWSGLHGDVAPLCTGSPSSFALESAAGLLHGDVSLNADGTFTYTFDPQLGHIQGVSDSFTFSAVYSGGTHSPAATMTVTPQNAAPVCNDASANVNQNGQVALSLPCADSNEQPGQRDPISDSIVAQPAHGRLVGDATTGSVTYTPDAGYTGADFFTFKTNDVVSDSQVARYDLRVQAPSTGGHQLTAAEIGAKLDGAFAGLLGFSGKRTVVVTGKKVTVGVLPSDACPGSCTITAGLSGKTSGHKRGLGVTSISFSKGHGLTLTITLNRAGRKLLAHSRKVGAVLTVTFGSGSVTRKHTAKVVLRRKHR